MPLQKNPTVRQRLRSVIERESAAACSTGYCPFLDLRVHGRITILGDLHGKLGALESILAERAVEAGLARGDHWLLSLGDLVDRGPTESSVDSEWNVGAERLLDRVAALKARHPELVHAILGNHEQQHLVDIARRGLEPGQVSIWANEGRLRLTQGRIAFLKQMPVALRVETAGTAMVLVHGGPPQTAFDLASASLDSAAGSARESRWHDLMWSNPSWTLGPQGMGYLYTEPHVRRFLEANRCQVLVRGHRDEDRLHRLAGGHLFFSVHSAKGPRALDEPRFGHSYVAWDPPAPPYLVRVTCEPTCPLPRPSHR